MRQNTKSIFSSAVKALSVALAALLMTSLVLRASVLRASATVVTDEIELATRSILLIDKSNSTAENAEELEAVLSGINTAAFDAVIAFSKENCSPICEYIDAACRGGYTHITVVTDGEQWPPEDYSSLGLYSDKEINLVLTEAEDEESEELVENLKGVLANSSLKVTLPSGEVRDVLNGYQPPKYTIEIEVPDLISADTEPEQEPVQEPIGTAGDDDGHCWWWLALLLAVLIAALFDFIHELLIKRREKGKAVERAIDVAAANGALPILDVSGSMTSAQDRAHKALASRYPSNAKVVAFADGVLETRASKVCALKPGGLTNGRAALKKAAELKAEELLLVSDLKFRLDYQEIAPFRKITVLAPTGYSQCTLDALRSMAAIVEVVEL